MRRVFIFSILCQGGLTLLLLFMGLMDSPKYLFFAIAAPFLGVFSTTFHAYSHLGRNKFLIFCLVSGGISLVLETLGVVSGWIYGSYYYSNRLGPMFLGITPYMIPLTWYMMLYPAYVIGSRLTVNWRLGGDTGKFIGTAATGAMAMTSWDLVLDPVMVYRNHWTWEDSGAYFGIPVQNFLGWWVTAFIILMVYQWFAGKISQRAGVPQDLPEAWAIWVYALVGMGSIASAWIAGLWIPAVIGVLTMGFWSLLAWKQKLAISNGY